jgi:GAF domain-containing protein
MNNCEEILMAMMAVFDGETTEFSPDELNAHLANCPNCRAEIEQMQNAFNLLKTQQRRARDADLWSSIAPRIEKKTSWQPFAFTGIFLVGYKLLELLPANEFGLAFKIVPLALVVALFVFLKENPFKINTELILEK